jgi:hypothetical protein
MTLPEIQALKAIGLATAEIVKALELLAGTKATASLAFPAQASSTKPPPYGWTAKERTAALASGTR